ncbi:MAG: hypothetical protein ABSB25_02475 [Sedimentisphaerales bacterium]|jgi:Mn-dependent DtxR family transcriptional regulator
MDKNNKCSGPKSQLEEDLKYIKLLLILLANNLGVKNKDIAKAMGISEGSLSKLLNPGKYSR